MKNNSVAHTVRINIFRTLEINQRLAATQEKCILKKPTESQCDGRNYASP